jgi:hypothetical protein
MNRRDFLSCFGLTVGSFFIPASVARRIRDTCVLQQEPLIIKPSSFYRSVIYAVSGADGYVLHYGDPSADSDVPTWRDFAEDQGFWVEDYGERARFLQEFWDYSSTEEGEESEEDEDGNDEPDVPWDKPITGYALYHYLETDYVMSYSPKALAYSYLSNIGLCDSDKRFKGDPLGRLDFIEGDAPGSNLTYVVASDLATIACLQHRLDELNAGISIEVQ